MSLIWFPFVVFKVSFEVKEPEKLPKKLFSSFRGVFGKALRKISCIARSYKSCLECPFNQTCAYGYLFETPRPKEADRLRGYPFIPHPFAFAPPFPYKGEKLINIRMTLVGKAIEYVPHRDVALKTIGEYGLGYKRAPVNLIDIVEEPSGRKLLKEEEILVPKQIPYPEIQDQDSNRIVLRFLTPTALKFSRKLVTPNELEFHIIVRNALRRISALSYFHAKNLLKLILEKPFQKQAKLKKLIKT